MKIIDKHASQYQIEVKVLSYLRSNDLQIKRVEARRINESMKNQTQRILEREQQHRLQNWSYFKEDLRQISQSDTLSRMSRLQGLGHNYLPLHWNSITKVYTMASLFITSQQGLSISC